MKKRVLKIIALVVAIALIVTVCWFANALCGNPISKWLAQRAASAYLEEQYPDTDYYIERLGFSFKSTDYYAHVRSETSMDTQFTLYIDMVGNVYFDTYDDVLSGAITAQRVHKPCSNRAAEQEGSDILGLPFRGKSFCRNRPHQQCILV